MNKNKQRLNNTRQEFLKTFFPEEKKDWKEVNGFWLLQHWNGNTEDWEVAIYTKDSKARYEQFAADKEQQSLNWIK